MLSRFDLLEDSSGLRKRQSFRQPRTSPTLTRSMGRRHREILKTACLGDALTTALTDSYQESCENGCRDYD